MEKIKKILGVHTFVPSVRRIGFCAMVCDICWCRFTLWRLRRIKIKRHSILSTTKKHISTYFFFIRVFMIFNAFAVAIPLLQQQQKQQQKRCVEVIKK
jgi:hypothetical protein